MRGRAPRDAAAPATGRTARRRRGAYVPRTRAGVLLVGAVGVVAQALQRVGGGAPPAAQRGERLLEGDAVGAADHDASGLARARHLVRVLREPVAGQYREQPRQLGALDLEHRAELLGEERGEQPVARRIERDLEAAAARERHLEQGRDSPPSERS